MPTFHTRDRKRVRDIDFWRGVALIVILIDHVPSSILGSLTPKNFGFSDAAEVFVFVSGMSVSLAYRPMFEKAGFGWLAGRCGRRAVKLYFVQIALTVSTVAIILAAAKAVGDEGVATKQGLSEFIYNTLSALVHVPLLNNPGIADILPLYMVLLLWAPVVLLLASRSPALALLASLAVYAAGRAGVRFDWFFNPFTWQLMFSMGVVCAFMWRDGFPPPQRYLVALASVVVLAAAILWVKAMGIRAAAAAHLDLDKSQLGLMRVLHFVALAYLVSAATVAQPWAARVGLIVGSPIGRSLQGIGRNGLLFFVFGSLLSAGGRSVMAAAAAFATPNYWIHFVGCAYTAAAVAGMFALAHQIDRTWRASFASRGRVGDESFPRGRLSRRPPP